MSNGSRPAFASTSGRVCEALRIFSDAHRFYRSMRGNALSFRFRDGTDFSSSGMTGEPCAADVLLGTGDGIRRRFELIKRYGEGELRRITRPVEDSISVVVSLYGVSDWEFTALGAIEFSEPPEQGVEVRAGFLFDVPVGLRTPVFASAGRPIWRGIGSVPLVEVREA